MAKYDSVGKVRLRDVLFLCHAKPLSDEQDKTWKQLIDNFCTCGHTHINKEKEQIEQKCSYCACISFDIDRFPSPEVLEMSRQSVS